VLDVTKGSPADKAGLQAGDVITSFDGKEITEMRFLPRMVAETKIGKSISVTYWRNNASKTVQITVGELDESEDVADNEDQGGFHKKSKGKAATYESVMGMQVSGLTPKIREQLNLGDSQTGIAVMEVDHGSEAAKHGISPGDVILDINGTPVKSAEDLRKGFESARASGRKFALLKVFREKDTAFVTLPTSETKKGSKKDKDKEVDE